MNQEFSEKEIISSLVQEFHNMFLKWHGFFVSNYIDNGMLKISVMFLPKRLKYTCEFELDSLINYTPGSFNCRMATTNMFLKFKEHKTPMLYLIKNVH